MSQTGNIESGEPNLLDGSPPCPGQILEGKYNDSLYVDSLSFEEWFELEDMKDTRPGAIGIKIYKFETTVERINRWNRYCELVNKIDNDKVVDRFEERMRYLRSLKTTKNKNRYELGAREFTLTYSPKWFSDEEARRQMSKAIEKLIKYYKDGDQRIIQLRAIGEVGSNGLSHIHCFYQLLGGVKISDKNFKRAYSPWDTKTKTSSTGHKGGHHATVKHHSDFLGYIEKEVLTAWLDVSYPPTDPN